MAEVTTTPIAVSYRDEGYLAAGISASANTVTIGAIYKYPSGVKTKQGLNTTGGFAEISLGNRTEIISFGTSSIDGTTKVTTWTDVRRGLSQTGTTVSFSAGTGLAWPKGAKVRVIDYITYIQNGAFLDKANSFTDHQTIATTKKIYLGDTNNYVTGTAAGDITFASNTTAAKTLAQLAAAAGTDEKIKVSSNDTTQSYLYNKVAAGTGISLTETNDGGDEDLTIAVSGATVPVGGTGVTSNTAYAVLCGGTTSTGAIQSIASVGTADQVLTSNGAGALPTMQDRKFYNKVVYMSTTNSSVATTSNNTVNFDTHTYSVPANDIVSGVAYRCHISGTNTSTSGTFAIGVKLGSTAIANCQNIATPATGDWSAVIDLFGTAAAGASVSVEATVQVQMDTLKTAVGQGAANVATNGGLTLQFYVSSNNVQDPIITHCWIEKISTTAFA